MRVRAWAAWWTVVALTATVAACDGASNGGPGAGAADVQGAGDGATTADADTGATDPDAAGTDAGAADGTPSLDVDATIEADATDADAIQSGDASDTDVDAVSADGDSTSGDAQASDVDDATVDAIGDDATSNDATGSDATTTDALSSDALDSAGADAFDAQVSDAVADSAGSADVDAGPQPGSLSAAWSIVAPQAGAVFNVGDLVTVQFQLAVTPPAANWVVTVQLANDPTQAQLYPSLPASGSMQVTILQSGPQPLVARLFQDGVLVAEASVTVTGNQPPQGTPGVVIAPANPTVLADLQASVSQPSVDPEGAPLSWQWSWLVDGQPTSIAGPTVSKTKLARGQVWTVSARASDGLALGPIGTASTTILNAAPTPVVLATDGTVVTLTGEATATIAQQGTDPDGDALQVSYLWIWNGEAVGNQATLHIPTTLVGGKHLGPGPLQVQVTVDDGHGGTAQTTQGYTIAIVPVCGTVWGQCDAHATCKDNATLSPVCTCNKGYVGDGATCTDIDECSAAPCDANATCKNSPGSFLCTCLPGFGGNGFACQDIDECKTGAAQCASHASCNNQPGSFQCLCDKGYTGDGFTCQDKDECTNGEAQCDVNATCSNNAGGYTCACNAGWSGKGFVCSDVNECNDPQLNACDPHATCLNQDGGYDCQCAQGWTGNGLTCSDIDECKTGTAVCDPHATCGNTQGGYTCTCGNGYFGDGKSCSDIDECKNGLANCDFNAKCTNTNGAYTCACNAGYLGDGKTCATACSVYCAAVMTNCSGADAQYPDIATCQAACSTGGGWSLGSAGDTSGNSVFCRYTAASGAALAPASFCDAAGPSGGNVCGSWCEDYCAASMASCPIAYASLGACQTACAALPQTGSYGDPAGNTVQCRDTYLALAALPANAASCAYAGEASSKCVSSVDLGGWKLEQSVSAQTFTIPVGTLVPTGGYLIVSRAATKADFELFWGVTLGPNVVYLQSAVVAGSSTACPQINGDETYTLRRADLSVADGPTVAMTAGGKFIFARTDPTALASAAGAWTATDYAVNSNATPGTGELPGKVSGAYISEFADAAGTGNFIYEYVEVYVDPGP